MSNDSIPYVVGYIEGQRLRWFAKLENTEFAYRFPLHTFRVPSECAVEHERGWTEGYTGQIFNPAVSR